MSRPAPVIAYVRVVNQSKLADEVLLRDLQPYVGRPLDVQALSGTLQRLRALGGFARLDYRIEQKDGREGLVVEADQRPGDTRRLRPGLTIAAQGKGHSKFDISAEYRMLQLDPEGSEARFTATLGDRKIFTAEYFKLLDRRQRWFVDPSAGFYARPVVVFDRSGFRLGEYNAMYGLGGLAVGRQIATAAELRIGYRGGLGKATLEEGQLVPSDVHIHTGQLYASGGFDTLDSPWFPRSGSRAGFEYAAGLEAIGESHDFQQASASGLHAVSFGRNSLIFNAEGGDTLQGTAPLPSLFTLGGPFNFPGYAPEELTGQTYFAARVMFRRRLTGEAKGLFGLPLYAGATVVTGNAWQRGAVDFGNLRIGGNVFIAADTLIGPVFLVVGAADRGRSAAYLFVGKPF